MGIPILLLVVYALLRYYIKIHPARQAVGREKEGYGTKKSKTVGEQSFPM